MSFVLDREIMKKSFNMGDEGNRFTHNAAKKIKLFPFVATTSNPFIVKSLTNVVGEWLRMIKKQKLQSRQVDDIIESIAETVDVNEEIKEKFVHVIKELYWDKNNQIHPNSIDSMIYAPISDANEERMAEYLVSVLSVNGNLREIVEKAMEKSAQQTNVLEKAVMEALREGCIESDSKESYFKLHTAAGDLFAGDLCFVLDNISRTKEYLVELLEFYYFFYTSQACLLLDRFEHGSRIEIIPLYFRLDWEKTNKARDCYKYGWIALEPSINNLFYHAITLDILNQNDSAERYDYIAIKTVETEDNTNLMAAQIQGATDLYRNAIAAKADAAELEEINGIIKLHELGPVFSEVRYLYDSIKVHFKHTNRGVPDRYAKRFSEYCNENFLKSRGQCGNMLTITEERLIFLTKLAIKDQDQMSLNSVFEQFEKRGVYFDSPSREEVIKFYLKLNLIDKKSDSGDAQYVKRFL